MPVSNDAVVKLFSNTILQRLHRQYPIRSYVVDHSTEMMGRRSMALTDLKRGITLNSRSSNRAAFGTAQQSDAAAVTLVKDKDYDFNEEVAWLDEMETVGSLMNAAQEWSMEEVAKQIETDILAKIRSATPQSTTDLALKTDGSSSSNAKKLTNDDGIVEILDWVLFTAAEAMARGQYNFAFLTAPKIRAAAARFLRDHGTDYQMGHAARALTTGEIPDIASVPFIPLVSIAGSSTSAGNNQFQSHLIDPGKTVHWAMQLFRTRVMPRQNAPVDDFQGILAHGALVPALDSSKVETMYDLQIDFTT